MSDNDKIISQYATSATLATRRGLYDTNVGTSLTERLAEQLQLTTASTFLDVGCGYGADIATFVTRYPHLQAAGFDQSEAQVQDAQKKCPMAAIFVDDVNTFEHNKTFDRILVRHVLHLIDNRDAAIDRILRHASEKARVVIAVHSSKSQPKFTAWRNWFKQHTGIDYSAPSDKLTLENNREQFDKSGWTTTLIEAKEFIHLTDPEPYLAYIAGQKRWSRPPTENEMKTLLEHVRAEIDADITQNGYFEDDSVNGVIILER